VGPSRGKGKNVRGNEGGKFPDPEVVTSNEMKGKVKARRRLETGRK